MSGKTAIEATTFRFPLSLDSTLFRKVAHIMLVRLFTIRILYNDLHVVVVHSFLSRPLLPRSLDEYLSKAEPLLKIEHPLKLLHEKLTFKEGFLNKPLLREITCLDYLGCWTGKFLAKCDQLNSSIDWE